MRYSLQIKQTKQNRLVAYSVLLVIFVTLFWYFNLLFISRPISAQASVLGVSTSLDQNNYQIYPYPLLKTESKPLDLARYWALIDADSGKTIVSSNAEIVIPIASTAKIMTALIILTEIKDLSQKVEIQKEINSIYQNNQRLRWGDEYTVENLLYLLLLESDNQAANSLAYFVAGVKNPSIEGWQPRISAFVKMMNERTTQIGLTQTKFVDPAGLDESTSSTSLEMAALTRHAIKNASFQKFVSTTNRSINNISGSKSFDLKNSNRLISEWAYPGAIGVKTGFLPNSSSSDLSAGHCLIAAAKRNNHTLIAAVYNTYGEASTSSATAAKELLDFGFENIEWY